MNSKQLKKFKEDLRIDDSDWFKCELTGISTKNIAFHHIVKRSQQGSDDRLNLIGVDWYVHSTFHDGFKTFKRYLGELGIGNAEELYERMGGKL